MNLNDPFNPHLILENDRTRLEPLAPVHFIELLPVALHKELWDFTAANVTDEMSFKKYFDTAIQEKENGLALPFAIFDKKTNQYAGSTRFGNISVENKRVEIGWTWYLPALQRTGLNRNCKFLLLSYAFETLHFNRVELKTSALNYKSEGAMLKLGAFKEGIFRRHMINDNGTLRDTAYFSFIKEEWPAIKQSYFSEF